MFRGNKDRDGKIIMDKEYLGHAVFSSLREASRFYRNLSHSVMSFVPTRIKSGPIINYNSYFFESLANSIDSIKIIMELGHITDAKALLRNFFDETIINLYFMARLKRKDDDFFKLISGDSFFKHGLRLEELYDGNTSDWLSDNKTKALQRVLRYDEMVKYLQQEACIAGIVEYLKSSGCKEMREWLNDAVHLNCYKAILLNDGLLCIDGARKSTVDNFKHAFDQITMFHTTCVFCLEPIYLMSSDYCDYLESGMEPPEGCQYEVSPFIQLFLDNTVYKKCPEWARKLVKAASPMCLRKLEEVDGHNNAGLD